MAYKDAGRDIMANVTVVSDAATAAALASSATTGGGPFSVCLAQIARIATTAAKLSCAAPLPRASSVGSCAINQAVSAAMRSDSTTAQPGSGNATRNDRAITTRY